MSRTARTVSRVGRLVACLAIGSAAARAGAQGTIAGRLTAAGGAAPIAPARVLVSGTALYGATDAQGRYTIREVPAGDVEVRAIGARFVEQKRMATVRAGETTTLDFVLSPAPVQLREVVTTPTGDRRRVELGSSGARWRPSTRASSPCTRRSAT